MSISRKGRNIHKQFEENVKSSKKNCDELEGTVLLKPEEGISVEYLNPSFLVKKPSGKKCLVTAFAEVGQYSKPQPALMPNVNQILRDIANWKYAQKSDLTHAYWQMELAKASMKYCSVVTPFKGMRAYGRGAMGMLGMETALEELMSKVLGNLLTCHTRFIISCKFPARVLRTSGHQISYAILRIFTAEALYSDFDCNLSPNICF